MIRRAGALLCAAALAACGAAPRLDIASVGSAGLTVTVTEQVSFRGRTASKSLRLYLRGNGQRAGETDVLRTTVGWAELTYVDADGSRVELATDGTRDDPAAGDAMTRARRGLLEGLVERGVEIEFAPGDAESGGGPTAVRGLASALDLSRASLEEAAVTDAEVVDAAAGGLEPLLDEEALLAGLRGAGLAPPPAGVLRANAEVTRAAPVRVDGRGWTDVALFGRAGEGRGRSPTVRLEGRAVADAAFAGDAGAEPPAEVGPVRVEEIRVTAETELDPGTLRPLRGNVSVELPHAGGPVVRRTTEFLFVVGP